MIGDVSLTSGSSQNLGGNGRAMVSSEFLIQKVEGYAISHPFLEFSLHWSEL